jgi:putative transposase
VTDFVHTQWKDPSSYDIHHFLVALPAEDRPLHAHTTEIIAYDLGEEAKTPWANRNNGMKVRSPWHKKAKASAQLRDFDHQVSRKAANHVITHCTAMAIAGDVSRIEPKSKLECRAGRRMLQQLSQWSMEIQERYLGDKTGPDLEQLNESGSSRTCPKRLTRNRPSRRYYLRKSPACWFTCHRDAAGSANIPQKAICRTCVPIGADTEIRFTYLRATERWSPDQRNAFRKVQCRKARALSSAQNRARREVTSACEPKQANSSTSSVNSDQFVAVA